MFVVESLVSLLKLHLVPKKLEETWKLEHILSVELILDEFFVSFSLFLCFASSGFFLLVF
jgi:hypothetical protein